MTRRPWPALCMLLTALALALLPRPSWANAGAPHEEGDPVGEPSGALAGMSIAHETLQIDLRPLADARPARVEATYDLRNTGAARTVALVFVAAALSADDFGVWVNGTPVAAARESDARLPASWKPPASTPPLSGEQSIYYMVERGLVLRFQAALVTGANTLRVQYAARAAAYSGEVPVRYWQLGYVLAPARDWAGFGSLAVTVLLPAGWRAVAEPALAREGDTLTGSFTGLPADNLAITVQAPFRMRDDLLPAAFYGGAGAVLVLGILVGISLGRGGHSFWWLVLAGAVLAVGWTVAVEVAGFRPRADVPPGQDAWVYGYGRFMLLVLGAPFIAGAGLMLVLCGGGIARALAFRARRARGPSSAHPRTGPV